MLLKVVPLSCNEFAFSNKAYINFHYSNYKYVRINNLIYALEYDEKIPLNSIGLNKNMRTDFSLNEEYGVELATEVDLPYIKDITFTLENFKELISVGAVLIDAESLREYFREIPLFNNKTYHYFSNGFNHLVKVNMEYNGFIDKNTNIKIKFF